MTNGLARVYAVLVAVVAFFVAWAAVAAHPWRPPPHDPGLFALRERQLQVKHDAERVRLVLTRRYAAYRLAYRRRERAIAGVRAEQRRLDALAAATRARYLTSAASRTVTVYTGAPAAQPTPAAAPATAPPLVSVPPVTSSHTS